MGIQDMVKEFHEAFDVPVRTRPTWPGLEEVILRNKLIDEEANEFFDAIGNLDFAHAAKELGDLAYVVYGTALTLGIDLDDVVAEVHRSNMSKLGEDGKPLFREDGKVLKGPNYQEADVWPILWPGIPQETDNGT